MLLKCRHILRIFFLFLYAVYAVTPVSMYAVTGESGSGPALHHPRKHASTDIVWVNVLYSSLVDDIEPSSTGDHLLTKAQHRGDMVLVKKRRALAREQFDVTPLFDTQIQPPGGLERPLVSLKSELTSDPLLRETDACLTLNSGLSPPFLS